MEKILFVDDEPNVANAFKRKLSTQFEFLTANSGKEGLEIIQKTSNIAIVISDMHMPELNGADFLKECARRSPDAVRVMLTGLVDQKTATRAINEGGVFKFINKPVSLDGLEKTIQECLVQRRLIKQERDLIQNTLGGVIKLISDLVAFVDPLGIDHSNRIRKVGKDIAQGLAISSIEVELSAMVSGVGRLSLPIEILAKINKGETLVAVEQEVADRTPQVSARLLKDIPRFEKISQILAGAALSENADRVLQQQSRIFSIANKIVKGNFDSLSLPHALRSIYAQLSTEERELIAKLSELAADPSAAPQGGFIISIKELCPGQRIMQDVKDTAGRLLLKEGFLITPAVIERLRNHQELIGIASQIIVNERIPTREK